MSIQRHCDRCDGTVDGRDEYRLTLVAYTDSYDFCGPLCLSNWATEKARQVHR